MKQIYANNFTTLELGRQGENLARKVVFDVRDLESLYGHGNVEVIHQRPGDAQPYPLAVQREGTLVTWDVTSTDTEMSDDYGKCELRYYVGDMLAKSKIWRTWVEPALPTPSETAPPEPEQGWVDQVLATGVEAQQAANSAKADADRAAGVVYTVNEAGSKAVQSVQSAGDTQVQRVTDEGTTQTANAKAQANAAAQSASGAAQSAQEAAESAAVYDDVVADVTQLKQDVAAITPDDTTVDGKPWTSKKIVDSICQPFEESGNPVQCYPVENYPLGVRVSWEPVQEGSGNPSPDNIRPIKGRDSVTVTRCGKNLWKLGNAEFNQYKEISVFFPSGRYVFSGNVDTEANTETVQIGVKIDNFWKYFQKDKNERFRIDISANHSITGFRLYAGVGPESKEKAVYSQLQLELGTTATPYEPYTGSTTDIALPETVYGGEVDAVSGEGQDMWKTLTLDGTEAWGKYGRVSEKAGASCFFLTINDKYIGYGTSVCNKFVNTKNSDPFNSVYMKKFTYTDHPGLRNVYMDYGDDQTVSLDEWKSYLAAQYAAGTPVQVCYKLAEPAPFTATGTQPIPALSGVNTLYTDADGVIVTGAEDPKHTITELKNAIISLGGNV